MNEEQAPWDRFGSEEQAPWEQYNEPDVSRNIAGITGAVVGSAGSLAAASGKGLLFGARKMGEAFRGEQPPATGTSGQKWLQNWANIKKEGVGGVPEAAQIYERQKPHGKVSSQVYKMYGNAPLNIEGYLEAQRQAQQATPPLERVSNLFRSMMGPLTTGMRYALPPVVGATSAMDLYDIGKELEKPSEERSVGRMASSGLGALGGLSMLVKPTVPGMLMSAAPAAYKQMQEHQSRMATDPEYAARMRSYARPDLSGLEQRLGP